MTNRTAAARTVAALLVVIVGVPAANAAPPLGGEMNHMLVELMPDNSFTLAFERHSLLHMQGPASGYAGVESVLNATSFNGQYGWLVSGFWAPPAGGQVWIEPVEQDERLSVYCGRAMPGVAYFQPIFGIDGSGPLLPWDGSMLHNYYAVTQLGVFTATYRVFMGDSAGNPLPGYTPGEITLDWQHGQFDMDGDEAFTPADVDAWANAADGDVNMDGVTDGADYALLVSEAARHFGPTCPCDLTGPAGGPDGVLNLDDINVFAGAFVAGTAQADLSADGVLNLDDINLFASCFVAGCP